jgi:hypothetical protein
LKLIKVKTIDKSTNAITKTFQPCDNLDKLVNIWKSQQKKNENLYVEIGDKVLLSLKEQKELEYLSEDFNDIASDIVDEYKKNPSEWPSGSGVFISGDSEFSRDVLDDGEI